MRVLLSTVGSRGDVQPMIALGLELRAQGHQACLCAPPDFRDLVECDGLPFEPVGIEVRHAGARRADAARPSPEALRQLLTDTIAGQFEALGKAVEGCDVVVACTALQYAAHSIAERRGIPYYFAAYCPIVFPSAHHAPPPLPGQASWEEQARRWNDLFGADINRQRAAIGLGPITDVRGYMFTDHPLLAADPKLAPWPTPSDLQVTQTGAWFLPDPRPLSIELEAFLASGTPPIYFGFGSVHTPEETSRAVIDAARALDRRAIVLSGWADLALVDGQPDCLSLTESNLQALFPRVAAIVHHGGSGTTTLATRSGTPQVIVPHVYDQHYFAERIHKLGIGVAHPATAPTTDSLVAALNRALQPEVVDRAKFLSTAVRTDGARNAAKIVTG